MGLIKVAVMLLTVWLVLLLLGKGGFIHLLLLSALGLTLVGLVGMYRSRLTDVSNPNGL